MRRRRGEAVVVVAHIFPDDVSVRLGGKRGDDVRERLICSPAESAVGGFARPHSVARNAWITLGAGGGFAFVIPHRDKAAVRAGGDVWLPLSAGRGVGVQFERRAKGRATIGGANVADVARVTVAGIARVIDVMNDAVGPHGRLAPAHVPPVASPGELYMQAK